jgi:hypothetical protein
MANPTGDNRSGGKGPDESDPGRLTRKTSTILISAGGSTKVYRSVADVPAPLRRRLLKSTSGANSATVLIADEGGRREILRSLQGLPTELQSRLVRSISTKQASGDDDQRLKLGWRQWIEIGLLGGIGMCLWLLAAWK